MKLKLLDILLFVVIVFLAFIPFLIDNQDESTIIIRTSLFNTGDNAEWANPGFDDSQWKRIVTGMQWQEQGYEDYHGYAWYRMHVKIPSSLMETSSWKDSLCLILQVDDVDATYLNGKLIGHAGSFPEEEEGYRSEWSFRRNYRISTENPAIHWDEDNVIAVRVYDGGGPGGISPIHPYFEMLEKIRGINIETENTLIPLTNKKFEFDVKVDNVFNTAVSGTLSYKVENKSTDEVLQTNDEAISIEPFGSKSVEFDLVPSMGLEVSMKFTEDESKQEVTKRFVIPYILTPPPSDLPNINGSFRIGVRPGSPVVYKIAATGKKPLTYSIGNLPDGLSLNRVTGLITGKLEKAGEYPVEITVSNKVGKDTKTVIINAGDLLALTPPMGWNSWNCWGLTVSDSLVRSSAQALIDKGLADHGWTYINIDDGWEASERGSNGEILSNEKFPDMKTLGDFLHKNGLKFGIYSSPGPYTCGGYLGTYQHELQDANTWAHWGIDYLKYDLCSYRDYISDPDSLEEHQKPYLIMRDALKEQSRDIVYSLCQYGLKDVWEWGPDMNGNLWRTTGDITDTWESLYQIGFSQDSLSLYAGPGRWNDPDMLIVGMLGWGQDLHPTRLNAYEQYTHISLWSLLSAPLLLGCDLARLDPFTLNLLTNDEVIAIDQDPLGKQATMVFQTTEFQIWKKELSDGNAAIGIFNISDEFNDISFSWADLGLNVPSNIRNLWTQQDEGKGSGNYNARIPWHGVKLIKVFK